MVRFKIKITKLYHLKQEVRLNTIGKNLSFCLIENELHLHYKNQPFTAVTGFISLYFICMGIIKISGYHNAIIPCIINLLKPTGHVMHQQFNIQQLYALHHTVFMCFVFIWEQTATCATYSLNSLVFIAEMKRVYSAVRTGSLNRAVCASGLYQNKQRLVPLTA